jgi:hypothetical protein
MSTAVRSEFRMHVAANVGVRVGGSTHPYHEQHRPLSLSAKTLGLSSDNVVTARGSRSRAARQQAAMPGQQRGERHQRPLPVSLTAERLKRRHRRHGALGPAVAGPISVRSMPSGHAGDDARQRAPSWASRTCDPDPRTSEWAASRSTLAAFRAGQATTTPPTGWLSIVSHSHPACLQARSAKNHPFTRQTRRLTSCSTSDRRSGRAPRALTAILAAARRVLPDRHLG